MPEYITKEQAINAAVNAWYGQLDDPGKELLLSMRHGAFLGQAETLEIVRCGDCDHGMQDCTPGASRKSRSQSARSHGRYCGTPRHYGHFLKFTAHTGSTSRNPVRWNASGPSIRTT